MQLLAHLLDWSFREDAEREQVSLQSLGYPGNLRNEVFVQFWSNNWYSKDL